MDNWGEGMPTHTKLSSTSVRKAAWLTGYADQDLYGFKSGAVHWHCTRSLACLFIAAHSATNPYITKHAQAACLTQLLTCFGISLALMAFEVVQLPLNHVLQPQDASIQRRCKLVLDDDISFCCSNPAMQHHKHRATTSVWVRITCTTCIVEVATTAITGQQSTLASSI
jgi:hypothetical protein